MSKFTRVCAAGLTSIVAVSVFAAPATAAEAEQSNEALVCEALVAPTQEVVDYLAVLEDREADQAGAVEDTRAALDAATVDLSSAALAYIHATDTEDGDVTGTAAAYEDATADFGDALVAWLEALDAHNVTTMEIGVYEVVVDFWTGVCPEEAV